ncbi:MAG: hypothetical protein JWO86_5350 [Myxococcaceae bacterium]|jgi:hypothetical protein|nr:hypothetical protein [Myxococcaceae bacterium]MEA2749489.1 hypothetical protein [Myxococcales bacterium]
MKTRSKTVITVASILCGLALSASASAAPGFAVDSTKLVAAQRTTLRTNIDKARLADPVAFHDVREIVSHAREADKHARGRKAPNSLRLAGLGTKALMPMLELVAFDAPPLAAGETAADRASVARDLIEAIGLLKDARSMPVLVAILERESDVATTRTAAEAVARMDSDEAANVLVATVDKATGERATAILAGMGSCHRTIVAKTIGDRLAAHLDDASAHQVIKSLGHAGSAWAWKTLPDRSEEAETRATAARALVTAFVQYNGEAREAAAKALLVVDDAHTNALIEAARRSAPADTAVALDELARRFASNPTH